MSSSYLFLSSHELKNQTDHPVVMGGGASQKDGIFSLLLRGWKLLLLPNIYLALLLFNLFSFILLS